MYNFPIEKSFKLCLVCERNVYCRCYLCVLDNGLHYNVLAKTLSHTYKHMLTKISVCHTSNIKLTIRIVLTGVDTIVREREVVCKLMSARCDAMHFHHEEKVFPISSTVRRDQSFAKPPRYPFQNVGMRARSFVQLLQFCKTLMDSLVDIC